MGIKFFFYFILYFILSYIILSFEREHEQGRGRERETEDPKQAPPCQWRTRHRAQIHRPWDRDLSQSRMPNWQSHPGTPDGHFGKTESFMKKHNLGVTGRLSQLSIRLLILAQVRFKPRVGLHTGHEAYKNNFFFSNNLLARGVLSRGM